jgi:hypothetical protein
MYHLKYITLSSCVILLSLIGCGKNCKDAVYAFTMQESFSPEKDSIAVGDTLWVISSHSTAFTDLVSNSQIDFSNSNLATNVRILKFPDTSQQVIGGVYDFGIIKNNGNEIGGDNIPSENKNFYFEEKNNTYLLNIGFIPKQKGLYCISLSNSISIIEKRGGCEKASVNIINTNQNSHLYYYQNFFLGLPPDQYTKTHAYCFKVY